MNKRFIYTTAAFLLVTGLVVLAYSNNANPVPTNPWFEKLGPCQHTLNDGSMVTLMPKAHIRWQEQSNQRGFEHLTGQVQVKVAKATTPFVVSSIYGDVTALGTEFSLTTLDGKAENQKQPLDLMAVEVLEGSVQVRNTHGQAVLKAKQRLTLSKDTPPYDVAQDPNLPQALVKRIQSMVKALETQDKAGWIANFNSHILFEFVKGKRSFAQIKDIWGGSPEDAERLKQGFQSVKDIAEFKDILLGGVNIPPSKRIYIKSVQFDAKNKHAIASCVSVRGDRKYTITSPQWRYFDNDWWQIDD